MTLDSLLYFLLWFVVIFMMIPAAVWLISIFVMSLLIVIDELRRRK